jgi:hypothetical protein
MRTETNDFFPYLFLETRQYGNRQDHYCQAKRDPDNCDDIYRLGERSSFPSAFNESLRYEIWQIHN